MSTVSGNVLCEQGEGKGSAHFWRKDLTLSGRVPDNELCRVFTCTECGAWFIATWDGGVWWVSNIFADKMLVAGERINP